MAKLWLATSMRPYPEDEPPFYNTGDFPWAVEIEQNWPIIKEEIKKFFAEKESSFVAIPLAYEKIAPQGTWNNLQFFFWGLKEHNGLLKQIPTLNRLVRQIPGVVSAGFSRLGEHTAVPAHHGDTNAIYRCHLGIQIPGTLPECGIRITNKEKNWEEGRFIIFNDAHEHSAWNQTDKRRIVLILDVMRPRYTGKKNIICAFVLARYVSYFYDRSKLIRGMPVILKSILFTIVLGTIYIFKPVYNLFKG